MQENRAFQELGFELKFVFLFIKLIFKQKF